MWMREDRSGGSVGLIIRSFVDAMSFFAAAVVAYASLPARSKQVRGLGVVLCVCV
jgi:hypothetical protein